MATQCARPLLQHLPPSSRDWGLASLLVTWGLTATRVTQAWQAAVLSFRGCRPLHPSVQARLRHCEHRRSRKLHSCRGMPLATRAEHCRHSRWVRRYCAVILTRICLLVLVLSQLAVVLFDSRCVIRNLQREAEAARSRAGLLHRDLSGVCLPSRSSSRPQELL